MYREWPYPLSGAVVWTSEASTVARTTRIMPDGCIDLIWTAGELFVAGPDTTARCAAIPVGASFVAARFAPGQAPPLLGVAAEELRNRQVSLCELWPRLGPRLADEITGAGDRPAAVAAWVGSRLAERPPDPLAREIARRLRHGDPVEKVAAGVGLSPRQLRRRSLTAFGYGPKTLGRVLRFRHAVALVHSGMRLAEVAAVAGYADQAHLSRDVRVLSGTTLTELCSVGATVTVESTVAP